MFVVVCELYFFPVHHLALRDCLSVAAVWSLRQPSKSTTTRDNASAADDQSIGFMPLPEPKSAATAEVGEMLRRGHQRNRSTDGGRRLIHLGYIPKASIGPEGVPKGLFPPPDPSRAQPAENSPAAEAGTAEVQ